MIRRLSAVLLGLGLLLPAGGAEIMGAEKALERLRAELRQPQGAADPKVAAAIVFAGHVHDLAGRISALPPAEAAAKWLALVDEWRGLVRPDESDTGSPVDVDFPTLFAALPGPDAWDALDAAVKARPHTGEAKTVAVNHCLDALVATLKGDLPAVVEAVKKVHALAKDGHADWDDAAMVTWLDTVGDRPEDGPAEPLAAVKEFEANLRKSEERDREATLVDDVPELIQSIGPVKAEALLKRLLVLRRVKAKAEDPATRRLAAKVALSLGTRLEPQWKLATGTSDEEAALFQMLDRHHPRKKDESGERDAAEACYLCRLVLKDQHKEALKLATAISKRSMEAPSEILGGLLSSALYNVAQDAKVDARLVPFFRNLLSQDPMLRYWEDLCSYSTKAGLETETAGFLRTMLARQDLPAEIGRQITGKLASLLQTMNRAEEAGPLLLQMLESERSPGGTDEPTMGTEKNFDIALELAELGRLLDKPEWLDAGIASARAMLAKLGPAMENGRQEKFGEFMFKVGRPEEAEEGLVASWIWEAVREEDPDQNDMGDIRDTLALADFYNRMNRPTDVYKLLEESPTWYHEDLAELIDGSVFSGEALTIPAARALAAAGKKVEARKLLVAFLQGHGGSDPAYAALLELGGDDLGTVLDGLFAADRFEERPLIWKASWLLQQGRTEDAEKTARAAIAIDPSDGDEGKGDRLRAYAVLGEVLEKKGDAAQAATLRDAVAAIRLAENADDYWKAGLLSRAIAMYEESLGHFGDAYCVQSRLALRYMEQGNTARAAGHFQRAFELMPDSFGAVESHCFGCEGIFSDARVQEMAGQVFERLAGSPGVKPQVFYLLGQLREEQGRQAEATAAYRRAVTIDPDYLNAWKAILRAGVPHAEQQAAALNILRLDPLGRHGKNKAGTGFGQITDFRAAWPFFEKIARSEPVALGPIMVLKASKEKLERPGGAGGRKALRDRPATPPSGPPTPGQEAAAHPALRALGGLIEIIKSGRRPWTPSTC